MAGMPGARMGGEKKSFSTWNVAVTGTHLGVDTPAEFRGRHPLPQDVADVLGVEDHRIGQPSPANASPAPPKHAGGIVGRASTVAL